VTLIGVGTDGYNLISAGGTTLFTNATFILYTNSVTPNANDSFQYSVQNAQGQTAMGTVNITVNNANIVGQNASIVVGNSGVTVSFFGVPNYSYTAERSTDLVNWVAIANNLVAPANGPMKVVDDFRDLGTPPPSAFYRLRYTP
jgi:hypothetical protein